MGNKTGEAKAMDALDARSTQAYDGDAVLWLYWRVCIRLL